MSTRFRRYFKASVVLSLNCRAVVELLSIAIMAAMANPRLIKRYARTRLYDTQAACYVALGDLRSWAAKGIAFVVIDAETGDDITRILLA